MSNENETVDLSDEMLATIERAACAVDPGRWYTRSGEPDRVRAEVPDAGPETFRYVGTLATDVYYIARIQPERVLALIAEVRRQRARSGVVTGEHEKAAREICRPYYAAEPIASAPPIESAIAEALAAERAAGARDMRERAAAVARDAAADWPSARERSVLDDAADRIAALPLEAPKVSP